MNKCLVVLQSILAFWEIHGLSNDNFHHKALYLLRHVSFRDILPYSTKVPDSQEHGIKQREYLTGQ